MKYLILGSRSYLGNSFSHYLEDNMIHSLNLNEINSNFYSTNILKNFILEYNPHKIVDFKFPIVTSNDDDFKEIDLKNLLKTQENFIEAINSIPTNKSDIYLISSANIYSRKNIYTTYKKNQEDYYKQFLYKKNKLNIIRLENVLGQGDTNKNRLVPYFFCKVLEDRQIKIEIHPRKKGKYQFLEESNKYILNYTLNQKSMKKEFSITYKDLINRFSSILIYEFDYYHKVFWNNKILIAKHLDKRDKTNQYLIKVTSWYLNNRDIISK